MHWVAVYAGSELLGRLQYFPEPCNMTFKFYLDLGAFSKQFFNLNDIVFTGPEQQQLDLLQSYFHYALGFYSWCEKMLNVITFKCDYYYAYYKLLLLLL